MPLCGSSRFRGLLAKAKAKAKRRRLHSSSRHAASASSAAVFPSTELSTEIGAAGTVTTGAVGTHGPIGPSFNPTKESPRPRLTVCMSMRLPRKLSKIRTGRQRREKERPAATEGSVWMKAIVLGERCKVHSDDDDEGGALYDDDGNRRRTYRPRTPRSLPVSPHASFMT